MVFLPAPQESFSIDSSFTYIGKFLVFGPNIGLLQHSDSNQLHEASLLLFLSETHQSVTFFSAELHDMGIGRCFCAINFELGQLIDEKKSQASTFKHHLVPLRPLERFLDKRLKLFRLLKAVMER